MGSCQWHPGIFVVFLSLAAVGIVVTAVTVFVIVAVAAFVTGFVKTLTEKNYLSKRQYFVVHFK